MPFFLMTGIFWVGLGAAAIPIVIHLLHRQRSTPVQWGAMQFLLDTTIHQRRRKSIDHWLLLLLRMAVIACLALLLARPLLPVSTYNHFASTTSSDIAIVIDHSLSMGRKSGDRTLFEHGADIVDHVVESLHPSDTLSVVLAEHTPRPFTDHPISNAASNAKEKLAQLGQSLHHLPPGMTDCSIADAVKAAREQVNTGRNVHKIIIVLTDQQRTNWQTGSDGAWRAALGDRDNGPDRDVAVYTIAVPPGGIVSNSPNVAVSNLQVTPAVIGINRRFTVNARVANSGPGDLPKGATIQLSVDGKFISAAISRPLPAGQSDNVSFDSIISEPGSHWLKVSADIVDGLEADNTAYAALDGVNRIPVLIIDGDLSGIAGFRASRFLSVALTSVDQGGSNPLFVPRTLLPADASGPELERYLEENPVVVLNDVPRLSPALVARLTSYVQAGHGLWIILGPRTDQANLAQTLGKTPLLPLSIKGIQRTTGNDFATVDLKEPNHATLAAMTANEHTNAFTGTHLAGWWAVEPAIGADSSATGLHTLMAVNHGNVSQPLVLAHDVGGSGGRVITWTSNVDALWNNLPVVTNFVPLVQETVLHLSAGASGARARRLESGQTLVWTGDSATPISEATISRPDGTERKVQPIVTNGKNVLTYNDTQLPGLYAIHFQPPSVPQPVYFTVNIDKAELDPMILSDADVEWLKTRKYLVDRITVEGLDKALGTENRGVELWPYTAVLLLFLLVGEMVVALLAVRLQEGSAVT